MLDGEGNLFMLEALGKKIIILDVLQTLVCKHFITSELQRYKAMADAVKAVDSQNLMGAKCEAVKLSKD